jgi:hypothetical protein
VRVHPALAALRSDRASQRFARQALEQALAGWRGDPLTRRVAGELAAHDRGAPLARCEALAEVMRDHRRARDWAEQLIAAMIAALRAHPLAEVPLRCRSSDGAAAVRLLVSGGSSLTLSALVPAEASAPQTVLFADRSGVDLVLAGEARGTEYDLIEGAQGTTALEQFERVWRPGVRSELTATRTRRMVPSSGPVLLLQLTRVPPAPRPTRQVCVRSGAVLSRASGDKQASRDHLALAVLGALEHRPALGVMAAVARAPGREADLRWEAVRQSLALDPARGVELLDTLAQGDNPCLAGAATRLRQNLLAAHPQLAREAA